MEHVEYRRYNFNPIHRREPSKLPSQNFQRSTISWGHRFLISVKMSEVIFRLWIMELGYGIPVSNGSWKIRHCPALLMPFVYFSSIGTIWDGTGAEHSRTKDWSFGDRCVCQFNFVVNYKPLKLNSLFTDCCWSYICCTLCAESSVISTARSCCCCCEPAIVYF